MKYSLQILKKKKIFFKRLKYPFPNALNKRYFWTPSYNYWGFGGNVRMQQCRKKVFHKCFSSILYKSKKQLFEGQKQPPEVFYKKRCSLKFRKIHRKTPVPESLFNKVAGPIPATLLKKRFRHRSFPVNFMKFLRTTFLQKTSGRMLLEGVYLLKIPRNYL